MIPVLQTVLGEKGNCFSACLASLFEIDINEVPNFSDVAEDGNNAAWWNAVAKWLAPRGFGIMNITIDGTGFLQEFPGFFIVSGKTLRGSYHATVWHLGEMIHDPHPSKAGLEAVETIDLIYPLNVAHLRLK